MQGEIVALVHSHPGGLPWLSEADRRLQVQSDLPWWLVCRGAIHKFRCVPHLTGRRFEHGVTDCYTLFRDAYHLAGIEMPDFHREDDWWRNGQNLYLDNLEATGLYQVPLSSAQPGDVLLCCFGSSVPNHAAIYCGDGELLHHIPEQLSKRERYTDKWQRRLSMEDTEEGKLSQFLVAANRIAFIDPANGNETPMFVAQGNQIFMNDVFLKRLTAPTITSGGSPPVFSLTSDGKLTAKNADISGSVNANSGTLNNVTINENCQIKGKLSANQIEGDIVKTVSKSFPRTSTYASGTITVRISDDQKFDRQVMIPPVLFRGGKHENFNSNNQQSYWYSTCRLRVTRNGQEIFNQSTTDAQGVFSSVIDMPAGQGTLTLTFTVSSSGANNWTPTTSISDLLVVVMKKSTAGISIS
ncbi:Fibronectin type III protein [Escherichia coli]|nr:Fibronectin type III protein [Escherichia coli]